MSGSRHYQRSPITDLRIEPVSRLCADDVETFQGEVAYRSVPPKRSNLADRVLVQVRHFRLRANRSGSILTARARLDLPDR